MTTEPQIREKQKGGRLFQKGQSGNPGGRPVVAKGFRDRCKEFMDAEGWQQLLELARTPARDQLPALTLIASYAYGKPTQPISGPDDGPIQFTYAALEADIQREAQKVLAQRAGAFALAGGDGEPAEPADTFG